MAITFFLMRSISGPDAFLIMARPSSRYNPILSMWMVLDRWLKRNNPTSSQISALSKEPIVTSKGEPLCFIQTPSAVLYPDAIKYFELPLRKVLLYINVSVSERQMSLNGKCRIKSIVYKVSITAPNISTRHYFGLCETEFKVRFYNHRSSFKDQRKMNATELSKAVWDYKNRGIEPLISWSIIRGFSFVHCFYLYSVFILLYSIF